MPKYLQSLASQWTGEIPEIHELEEFSDSRVRAVMYSGFRGKRNFAYIGLPEGAGADRPVPGMVLVHGGLGTAYRSWVELWTSRGFAAIAMDTCGHLPDAFNSGAPRIRHAYSGPEGWGAFGEQAARPHEDQWFPHALCAIVHARTILGNLPGVDASRIGMTGISWGSVLAGIAAGTDRRYQAVSLVYGSGFLSGIAHFEPDFAALDDEQRAWWCGEWDLSNFVGSIDCPVQFYTGTNDMAFYPPEWQKTTALVRGERDLCMKLRWIHSHGKPSESPAETEAFFRQHLRNGTPRLRFGNAHFADNLLRAELIAGDPDEIVSANLACTWSGEPRWPDREWHLLPAGRTGKTVEARVPENARAGYLSVLTREGLYSTSEPVFAN